MPGLALQYQILSFTEPPGIKGKNLTTAIPGYFFGTPTVWARIILWLGFKPSSVARFPASGTDPLTTQPRFAEAQ